MSATPREYIEGFTDPLLVALSDLPVYLGGDQTTSPFLSLDAPPTHPVNNPIAFFTGEDDYLQTRTYGLWLNSTEITVMAYDYESMSTIVPAPYAPWTKPAVLEGTDGMQFQPQLTEKD